METKTCHPHKKQRLTLAASCFAAFALLNIPVALAIPIYNQTLDVSEAKLVNREEPLITNIPPGSTQMDGSFDLLFYGAECKLGIYDGNIRNADASIDKGPGGRWEGYPLGTRAMTPIPLVFPEHKCVRIGDLHLALANRISSYTLTGYCECRFYDHEGCPDVPGEGEFTAFNREDGALWNNGPDNDSLESFQCWFTKHFEDFRFCTVRFAENPAHAIGRPIDVFDVLEPKPPGEIYERTFQREELEGTPDRVEGESDCQRLPDGFALNYLKINGCSCRFYTSDNCDNSSYMFTEGTAGRVEKLGGLGGGARSYRCLAPFGLARDARDDL
ncbi:hypothetical protein TWF481_007457 [Arthrobotrys musiformis]|uniref:Uncharacterized protein n=1 Tax=Arthrobotrys musiformis TaxID=47236 RepID=A0AAV9WD49_9PEZI